MYSQLMAFQVLLPSATMTMMIKFKAASAMFSGSHNEDCMEHAIEDSQSTCIILSFKSLIFGGYLLTPHSFVCP